MRYVMCLIATLLAIILHSCGYDQKQRGFPEKVFLGSEATTVSYKGKGPICHFILKSGNRREFSEMKGDSIYVTLDWLTVKAKSFGDEMIIIAEPMESTTSRKASIEGSLGETYFITNVTQKR